MNAAGKKIEQRSAFLFTYFHSNHQQQNAKRFSWLYSKLKFTSYIMGKCDILLYFIYTYFLYIDSFYIP